jgi:PiT family inorganic phosphate transporter
MGAGSADRVSKVRWNVARDIAAAWLLTIPTSALVAAGLHSLIDLVL